MFLSSNLQQLFTTISRFTWQSLIMNDRQKSPPEEAVNKPPMRLMETENLTTCVPSSRHWNLTTLFNRHHRDADLHENTIKPITLYDCIIHVE